MRTFVERVAALHDIQITWEGEGVNEKGRDQHGKIVVDVSERYFRPAEVETLLGDASKARACLGWTPEISFEQLVEDMVRYE